jgi:hypothetical protein
VKRDRHLEAGYGVGAALEEGPMPLLCPRLLRKEGIEAGGGVGELADEGEE